MVKNKFKTIRTLLFILPFLILHLSAAGGFFTANATVRYVSHNGSNTPPYTSWATAADSIMSAINISVFGDTIYVANGVYEEQVVMIPGLSLIGAGADSCVIDTRVFANSTEFQALIMADSCILKGFHLLVSNNNEGIGIMPRYIDVLIENNKITNAGIGIWLFNSNSKVIANQILEVTFRGVNIEAFNYNYYPIIENNLISTYQFGVNVFFGTRPTIRNNIILLNSNFDRGYAGGGSDSVWIYSNLIIAEGSYSNTSGLGNSMVPTFEYNNVVIGDIEKGISCRDMNIIKNNLVLYSKDGVKYVDSGNQLVAQYNNAWNNDINYSGFTPDSTNLSVDPMIVNEDSTQGELDFHLQMFSPLIDAGDPNIRDVDSTRSDIGLYGGPFGESYTYPDLAPRPPVNLTALVDSNYINVSWNRNTEADFRHYSLFRDTTANFTADSTTFVIGLTDTFYQHIIPPGTDAFYYKLTAVDNQGNESGPSEELAVIVTSVNDFPATVSNYQLYQNYPNPFNPSTKIAYKLKERGYVKLYVYDIKGELVSVLVNQTQNAGYYEVEFFGEVGSGQSAVGNNLASGIYIYQIMIKSENNISVFTDMKKMLLLK